MFMRCSQGCTTFVTRVQIFHNPLIYDQWPSDAGVGQVCRVWLQIGLGEPRLVLTARAPEFSDFGLGLGLTLARSLVSHITDHINHHKLSTNMHGLTIPEHPCNTKFLWKTFLYQNYPIKLESLMHIAFVFNSPVMECCWKAKVFAF